MYILNRAYAEKSHTLRHINNYLSLFVNKNKQKLTMLVVFDLLKWLYLRALENQRGKEFLNPPVPVQEWAALIHNG